MNTKNALGFLVVGVVMKSLPALAPDWFPPTGPDGTSASAIWLNCMGPIEIIIGGWYVIRQQTASVLKLLAAPVAPVAAATVRRPLYPRLPAAVLATAEPARRDRHRQLTPPRLGKPVFL